MKLTIKETDVLLSDEDAELANENWTLSPEGYVWQWNNDLRRYLFMHHAVLIRMGKCPHPDQVVDHVNNIKYDNRRDNLRIVSRSLNMLKSVKRTGCTSKHKGVYQKKTTGKWVASLTYGGRENRTTIQIGTFSNEEDAAKAYKEKVKELFGKLV